MMQVHQILNAKSDDGVVTIPPGTTVAAAAELLSSRRIGAIIVSKDGKVPLGILSERDIVRELGRRGPGCMSELVDDMMTRKLVGCLRNDSADDVLTKMTDGRFRHMPVMDGDQMVGLISIGDVVKARLSELSMEKEALEGMIMGH
jgi:CBS domain-containing protein